MSATIPLQTIVISFFIERTKGIAYILSADNFYAYKCIVDIKYIVIKLSHEQRSIDVVTNILWI